MSGRRELDADALIIGAGVVGLAVARALARRGLQVLVLERNRRPGEETSARNSGVIHSGIYYPADSLKARACVRGRQLLYRYCEEHGIEHRRCGKLIVAQAAQEKALQALQAKALRNGVDDLQWLDDSEVRGLEPDVHCAFGLFSPSTGIVDVHGYLTALQGDMEAAGGVLVCGSDVATICPVPEGYEVDVVSGGEHTKVLAARVVNSAGLAAIGMLGRIGDYPTRLLRKAWYAKGNYFVCRGQRPFRHLVYPMPNEAGLGVHATLDLDGITRFGPDVEWTETLEYDVNPARADSFYGAIREYWPGLADGALQPGYAGVRPKLVGESAAAADFIIEDATTHGLPGLVNLLGIESPGLTASLALAGMTVMRLLAITESG